MTSGMKPSRDIQRLIAIMAALRTPGTGCPWDLKQDFGSIAPYTIEEAYEVAEAIARGDLDDLKDELGDLLLQVVFHARMAEEQGVFTFDDVVLAITDNGHGFDVEQALSARRTPGTFGLVAIRERVRLLHGTMEVHSAEGQGTTIIVTVPYEAQHGGPRAPKLPETPVMPVVVAGDGT